MVGIRIAFFVLRITHSGTSKPGTSYPKATKAIATTRPLMHGNDHRRCRPFGQMATVCNRTKNIESIVQLFYNNPVKPRNCLTIIH